MPIQFSEQNEAVNVLKLENYRETALCIKAEKRKISENKVHLKNYNLTQLAC